MKKEEILTFKYFLNLIFRRLGLFFLIFLISFIFLLIYHFRKPYIPIYKASFEIGISKEKVREDIFSERNPYYSPISQIAPTLQRVISNIMDVEIAKKIADSFDLYLKIEDVKNVKIDSRIKEEYNSYFGPYLVEFFDEKNFEVKDKNGKTLGKGEIGKYFDIGPLEFKILEKPEKNFKISFYPIDKISLAIRNSINIKVLETKTLEKEVFSGIPYSGEIISKNLISAGELSPSLNILGIMRINLYWGNPYDAFKIAKCLSDFILKYDILEKTRGYVKSREFIESQLSLYSSKLDSIENEIRKFKEKEKIVNLEVKTQSLISRISELESKKEKIALKEKLFKDFNEKVSKGENITDEMPNFMLAVLDDPILQKYYTDLIEIENEYRSYKKEYSFEHPKIREISSKLFALREGMKEEISKRMESINIEKKGLEEQIQNLSEKLKEIPEEEILLAKLEKERERIEKLYSFFAEKLEEIKIQEAGITSDLKIVNPPTLSYTPINKRNTSLILIFSFFISIFLSLLITFFIEYFDPRIKDVEILKNKITLLGLIPDANEKNNLFFNFLNKKNSDLKILQNDSIIYEDFKKLFFNLNFVHPEKRYKLIYITSIAPSEGKTFITLNLGKVLKDFGKRVLIMDTDFRKKEMEKIFDLRIDKGIFDYLSNNIELSSILKKIDENLYLISPGKIPPNPLIYFESNKFEEFLKELKENFDYVLIDGLPILLFSEPLSIARKTDGVIIVLRYSYTHFDAFLETLDLIKNSGSELIGAVFNCVPIKRGAYYYYKYYKYYSKYYKRE
jgi:capsular exopolysaccharide synthesis family protein